ncbi:MAG: hypothetical protein JSU01_16650 [Bacteroidetes bacterium]|nr:hypothetical protein [Bacteroidota bacterium]
MRKILQGKNALPLFGVIIAVVLSVSYARAQKAASDTAGKQKTNNQVPEKSISYPKPVGYLSFIIPFVTANSKAITPNFKDGTSIGFPVGVNVLYSNRFGFSYEFTPTIKWAGGTSKMSNLLFDPGTMFRFDHGFTVITRLAFETSGRYGVTPVFNQVYARTKDVNYFVAVSLPARFGNSQLPTLGLNLQIGFTFN